MVTPVVVVVDVCPASLTQLDSRGGWIQIYVFHLQCPPETLCPDIVLCASLAVHRDRDAMPFTGFLPFSGFILASLVGIDDSRRAVQPYRLIQHINGVCRVQTVVQSPCHYGTGIHVDDCRQVHEAMCHRYIGDVYAPNLPWARDFQSAQKIRTDVSCPSAMGQTS